MRTHEAVAQALERLRDSAQAAYASGGAFTTATFLIWADSIDHILSGLAKREDVIEQIRHELEWYLRDGYKTDSGRDLAEHLKCYIDPEEKR